MLVAERRRRILEAVQERGALSMREIAHLAGTSEVTARRDLRVLAAEGLLRRTHGGATLPALLSREPTYLEKAEQAAGQKAAIADLAVDLVQDGDTIAVGAGTTTAALATRLTRYRDLTVITNSLLVCEALIAAPGVHVLLSGGTLRIATRALVGPLAERSLADLYVSRLFLSGNGLSAERGLSTPDELAAAVDRRLAASAAEVVVLADHTKIGVEATYQTIPVARMARLLTDPAADQDALRRLRAAGVAVGIAPPAGQPFAVPLPS